MSQDVGSIPTASKSFLSHRLHFDRIRMKEVVMGQAEIDLVCETCGVTFSRRETEVKRSRRLGRSNFCSRGCSAAFKNKLPESRIRQAEINRKQTGNKNHNWKGGVSNVESVLKSRSKYPKRYAARKALQQAVKTGSVLKPDRCETCNKRRYLTAHHEDYEEPLEVDWLCRQCHGAADRSLRKRGGL